LYGRKISWESTTYASGSPKKINFSIPGSGAIQNQVQEGAAAQSSQAKSVWRDRFVLYMFFVLKIYGELGMEDAVSNKNEPVPAEAPQAPDADWFLRNLVGMVNDSDMEIGITLHVAGFLVTGLLASGRKYFEELGNVVAAAYPADPDAAKAMKDYFSQPAQIYTQMTEGGAVPPPPGFIHIKNAQLYHNSGKAIPADSLVWWRGKIIDVSGFFLGSLKAS